MIMLMCILSYLKHLTLHLHYVKITVETLSSRAWSDCVITHAHIQKHKLTHACPDVPVGFSGN